MTLSKEQYMALSVAAYGNYTDTHKTKTFLSILSEQDPKVIDADNTPAAASLHNTLSGWTLLDFIPNTTTGYQSKSLKILCVSS